MYLYALVAAALFTICKSTQTYSERGSQATSQDFDPKIHIKGTRRKRNVIIDKSHRWKDPVIEYEISSTDYSTADRATIAAAFKHIDDRTCLRFVSRKAGSKPYIYVGVNNTSPGCSSNVGLWANNTIGLGPGCVSMGIVVHEIMHNLGFYHEQSRKDRDTYISIHQENIKPGSERNFDRHKSDIFGPYDYHSVMHYDARAFSKNNKPTIVPKRGQHLLLGQRIGMSDSDAMKVNRLFKCKNSETRYQKGLKEAVGKLKKLKVPDLSKLPMSTCPKNAVSDKECQDWKIMGYCLEQEIVAACPKLCSNTPSCRKWAGYGYCTDKHLKSRMRVRCPCAC